MDNTAENKKNLENLLNGILMLKHELNGAYLTLRTDFNSIKNAGVFYAKKEVFNKLAEEIKGCAARLAPLCPENGEEDADTAGMKNSIRAEIMEIANINSAFSGLIKKNMHYNQLTISFIADAFNKSSIYNRAGVNNSNFFPLKSILMGSGVRI